MKIGYARVGIQQIKYRRSFHGTASDSAEQFTAGV